MPTMMVKDKRGGKIYIGIEKKEKTRKTHSKMLTVIISKK